MKHVYIKRRVILFLIFSALTFKGLGQDVTFTHFMQNPIYYNPAAVGIDQGMLISLNYRRALMYLPSKFETIAFGLDQSLHDAGLKGMGGIGLYVTRNQEGEGNYSTTAIGIPISSRVILSEKLKVQVGITPTFYQKSIDFSQLVYFDQLDTYYGFDSGKITSAQLSQTDGLQRINFFDFSIGIFGRYETDPTDQNNVKNDVFDFGFSVQHVPQPNQSFTGETSKLPSKYSLMLRYSHVLKTFGTDDTSIQPVVLLEKQSSMRNYITGINFKYKTFNMAGFVRHDQNKLLKTTEVLMLIGTEFKLYEKAFSSLQVNYSFNLLVHSANVNRNISNEVSLILHLPSLHHPKDPCDFYF
jgi:type IX secretion system PorP/SprF family membrane protein